MTTMEYNLENERNNHIQHIGEEHKKALGQYFTPVKISRFMASMFPKSFQKSIRILDPGAGIGILACCLIERIKNEKWPILDLEIQAYDIDIDLTGPLRKNLKLATLGIASSIQISSNNFLESACQPILFDDIKKYTHVIMNPPYAKINSKSNERLLLRNIGVETGNLYSGFLAAAIHVTEELGHIVAIIPRSFCNGVYFKPFRQYLLERCCIEQIHLFESRKDTFKEESVLQENIIIHLQKGAQQKEVLISYSSKSNLEKIEKQYFPFSKIVNPKDISQVINIPIPGKQISKVDFYTTLIELGLSISTGPIVDFRMRDLLQAEFRKGTYPLLYPTHFKDFKLNWPKTGKKPNAILEDPSVKKHLFPSGYYVVVKRFSSKEEPRRIVASIITEESFPTEFFTIENHLNFFHFNKQGFEKELAYGLFVYLNTSYADELFRIFSGHTQVNATDLKNFNYPARNFLIGMGKVALNQDDFNQAIFDMIFQKAVKSND
ncbi:Eco57I restriction-modification methylase domain-containing protein [Sphaerochaeta sp. PS]|uniref:Eco57I restriction-modification methylase domain-containing protein n=1 Tax=Sphaerochaeta sp. PS TaxID=3076336 RepID=UPI0028A3A4E7|nr:N-6 DNA methylase [Sphaerochaeta sp. PS]MDT4761850.1 N-6 DNA methylase [Sphaerochaeta sp. PS]